MTYRRPLGPPAGSPSATEATACNTMHPDQASSEAPRRCHALQRADSTCVACSIACSPLVLPSMMRWPHWPATHVYGLKEQCHHPLGSLLHLSMQGALCRQGTTLAAERATLRVSAGSPLPKHHPSAAAPHRCPPACCAQSTRLWLAAGPESRWTLGRPLPPVQVATIKCHVCVFHGSIWCPGAVFCLS